MSNEEKINNLQNKISKLADELNSSQQELHLLQAELMSLQKETGIDIKRGLPPTSYRRPFSLENFIGLNIIHLVGIIVLITGIAIGVKYAIDKQLISPVMRILLAYSAGLLLYFISVRLRNKYHLFSAILFSGAMASIYFTTYAATAYYQLIAPIIAFIIMIGLTIYTTIMALNYDRKEIAIVGMTGAYAIPFLVSANADRVELFFSYILLINLGIVFLYFRKGWKLMGQLAMLITWILFIGWEFLRFESSQFTIGVIFSTIYFLLFTISAIVFKISKGMLLTSSEIQQIGFNNTAFYFAALLLTGDLWDKANMKNATVLILAVIVILTLISVYRLKNELKLQRLLTIQSLLLLIVFVALRWIGLVVTLVWVVIAIFLFMWGVRARKSWIRMASIFLTGITLLKLIFIDSTRMETTQRIICYITIGTLLLVFSFLYQKYKQVLFTDDSIE